MYALAGVELAIGAVTWVRSANDAPRAAPRRPAQAADKRNAIERHLIPESQSGE